MAVERQLLNRRGFLGAFLLLPAAAAAAEDETADAQRLRGKLEVQSEDAAGLRLPDGSFVRLEGDDKTELVLRDERLKGLDFEVLGEKRKDGTFGILPIHLAALFVHEKGKRLRVTYYCDVCAIRTYAPGICMCCREETRLDLVEPGEITKVGDAAVTR